MFENSAIYFPVIILEVNAVTGRSYRQTSSAQFESAFYNEAISGDVERHNYRPPTTTRLGMDSRSSTVIISFVIMLLLPVGFSPALKHLSPQIIETYRRDWHWTYIWEVLASSVCRDTCYPKCGYSWFHFLQRNAWILPQLGHHHFLPNYYYSTTVLPSDAI